MKSFTRLASLTAIAAAALSFSAQTADGQALPSAPDVIARYVAAIGGKDAIMQIKSISSVGTLDVPAMGLSAKMEVVMAAPNKVASKTNIPGMGEIVTGFDGTVGWAIDPSAGERLQAGKELEQTKENSDFYANFLYPVDRYTSMEVQSIVDFNGEKAYKVKMVRKGSGNESTQYFSVANALLLGSESAQVTPMGNVQVTQTVRDYKQFGSIKMATKVEQAMGPTKLILTTSEVKLNEVPANAFDMPDRIKPLVKP